MHRHDVIVLGNYDTLTAAEQNKSVKTGLMTALERTRSNATIIWRDNVAGHAQCGRAARGRAKPLPSLAAAEQRLRTMPDHAPVEFSAWMQPDDEWHAAVPKVPEPKGSPRNS